MIERPVAVVFDLDDTLADTSGTVLFPALKDAGRAMIAAGLDIAPADLDARVMALGHEHSGRTLFLTLAIECHAADPEGLADAAVDAFYRTPRDAIRLRPGALSLLEKLAALGVPSHLLTFGDPRVQREKIRILGLEGLLQSIEIVDLRQGPEKHAALRHLIEEHSLPPERTWVVGDRVDGEITAGNRLGCVTIRVCYGEFAERQPRSPVEHADLTVRSLRSLSRLL